MSGAGGASPPPLTRALLRLLLPRGIRGEAIRGDLDEEFVAIWRTGTRAEANAWYRRQALRVLVSLWRSGTPRSSGPGRVTATSTWAWRWSDLREDTRYAWRRLLRMPVFTVIAVATIAIAIAANTTMFSVLDAVLLRPLPYPDADRIVQIWETNPKRLAEMGLNFEDVGVNALNYRVYAKETKSFDRIGYTSPYRDVGFGILGGGDGPPEKVGAWSVSPGFFGVFGVQPMLGRSFLPEEQPHDGSYVYTPVVVLSHDIWMRRFGGDPDIIGKEIQFESGRTTVVGVLPPHFQFPALTWQGELSSPDVDVYLPLHYPAFDQPRNFRQFRVVARLAPGVTVPEAASDLERVAARLATLYPDTQSGWTTGIEPLHGLLTRDFAANLSMLMGMVAFVLLIACANIANLLLAQGVERSREMALRASIGGGRIRLIQQLLTESLLLAAFGGVSGVVLARWGTHVVIRMIPSNIPRAADAGLHLPVLLFALALTMMTGIVFGLLPALRGTRLELATALKESTPGAGGHKEWRLARLLVAGQVMVTVVLLVGGGVLGKRFFELSASQPDFSSRNILVARWGDGVHHPLRNVPPTDSAGRRKKWRRAYEILEQTSALPGVTSAAFGTPPLVGVFGSFPIQFTPKGDTHRDSIFRAGLNSVSPNYFKALGIPIVRGQGLPAWDGVNDWRRYWWATICNDGIRAYCKALVSETFAARVWPGQDPIGKELGVYGCCWTVAGVVKDVQYKKLDQWWGTQLDPNMQVYVSGANALLLTTSVDPLSLAGPVREAIRKIDDGLVVEFTTLDELASESLVRPRFFFAATGFTGVVALILALVGLYGVIAYSVTRRTQEIGLRMALGAGRVNVRTLVLGQALRPVVAGLTLGLALSLALVRVLKSLLYGAGTLDPWVMAGVGVSMAVVAALACWIPAWRASSVDPVRALAHE